ncbi:MAG: DRTGG domain-containing protein [Sphaerochaetaceae bacterium]|nr:DRTGG domain-containing protein [Spirochaetales bacterium]MDY5499210.1 DRTGG domain-containing protein [Sphaerochaetaceae bacterium]
MTPRHIARYGTVWNLEEEDQEFTGCYVGDLLSDVLAHAKRGSLLVTTQNQRNTLAVAAACHLPAIVLTGCDRPEEGLVQLAKEHHLSLFSTRLDNYSFLKQVGVWI